MSKFLYYESIKRDLKTTPVNECRCDENLKLRNLYDSHTQKKIVYYESIKRQFTVKDEDKKFHVMMFIKFYKSSK